MNHALAQSIAQDRTPGHRFWSQAVFGDHTNADAKGIAQNMLIFLDPGCCPMRLPLAVSSRWQLSCPYLPLGSMHIRFEGYFERILDTFSKPLLILSSPTQTLFSNCKLCCERTKVKLLALWNFSIWGRWIRKPRTILPEATLAQ